MTGEGQGRPLPLAQFFTLWTGQAVSAFGSALAQFALIWWITLETGSATALVVAMLMYQVPVVFLGPIIGVLIDRLSRKRILLVSDSLVALASLLLAALFFFDAEALWHVYAILLIRALGILFHEPTMMASTALMVPETHLTRIQGMNQTLGGLLLVAVSPLAALLLAFLPIEAFLLVDFVTALFAVVPLLFIRIPQPTRSHAALKSDTLFRGVWRDLTVAFAYVWRWRGLSMFIGLAIAVNLFLYPAFKLLPLFVTEDLGGGALELGALEAALGGGTILGGLLMSTWGGFKRRVKTSLSGIVLAGLGIVVLSTASSASFPLALLGCGVAALAFPVINGPFSATLQAAVTPDLHGRVFTLTASLAAASTPIALVAAGPLADTFGVRPVFLVCGLVCLGLGIFGFYLRPLHGLETAEVRKEAGSSAA